MAVVPRTAVVRLQPSLQSDSAASWVRAVEARGPCSCPEEMYWVSLLKAHMERASVEESVRRSAVELDTAASDHFAYRCP